MKVIASRNTTDNIYFPQIRLLLSENKMKGHGTLHALNQVKNKKDIYLRERFHQVYVAGDGGSYTKCMPNNTVGAGDVCGTECSIQLPTGCACDWSCVQQSTLEN